MFRAISVRIFAAVMVIGGFLGLLFFVRPDTSEVEKRTLTEFPKPTLSSLWNGEFFSDLSLWYSDTYPMRDQLIAADQKVESVYGIKTSTMMVGNQKQSDDIPDYRLPALNTAYEKTNQFIEELKILYNNIKRYHQRIAKMEDVNELLTDHFDSYYVEIAKKIIEPIRTIDSVPRFKNQILEMLDRMENDADVLSSLISGGVAKGFYKDDDEAEADIRTKIHTIMDIYSTVERTLSEIDAKHSAYIRSSIERMRYMMSSSRGTRGDLISVLKACRDDAALLQEMAHSIDLVSTKHIDSGSFFDRIARRAKDEGGSEPVARYGENENEVASLFDELRSQYGSEEIDAFILSRMDGDELDSYDIPIVDLDSFLLLILATIRAQEADSPYECHFADGVEERNGGISIAHCVFRRRR